MTLLELIQILEAAPQDKVCEYAFGKPHSWRGIYAELAFEPATNRTVAEMLADAKSAVGAAFPGYKGGQYTMNEWSDVHIGRWGTLEDLLPEYGLRWMLTQ